MALSVCHIGETEIRVHVMLLLVAAVMAVSGFLLHLVVFLGSVFVHEMGHIVAAGFLGAAIRKVELWPFGAVAKLESSWQLEPQAEALVSAWGPLSSAALACAAMLLGREPGYPLLDVAVEINVGLFLVNALPCLPLDGGRFLRAHLALKVGYRQATEKMLRLGLPLGVVASVAGVLVAARAQLWHPALLVGPTVLWGAMEERKAKPFGTVMELLIRAERLATKKAIPVEETLVSETTTVRDAVKVLKPSKYHVFLVRNGSMRVKRRVTETEVLEAFYGGQLDLALGRIGQR